MTVYDQILNSFHAVTIHFLAQEFSLEFYRTSNILEILPRDGINAQFFSCPLETTGHLVESLCPRHTVRSHPFIISEFCLIFKKSKNLKKKFERGQFMTKIVI